MANDFGIVVINTSKTEIKNTYTFNASSSSDDSRSDYTLLNLTYIL